MKVKIQLLVTVKVTKIEETDSFKEWWKDSPTFKDYLREKITYALEGSQQHNFKITSGKDIKVNNVPEDTKNGHPEIEEDDDFWI